MITLFFEREGEDGHIMLIYTSGEYTLLHDEDSRVKDQRLFSSNYSWLQICSQFWIIHSYELTPLRDSQTKNRLPCKVHTVPVHGMLQRGIVLSRFSERIERTLSIDQYKSLTPDNSWPCILWEFCLCNLFQPQNFLNTVIQVETSWAHLMWFWKYVLNVLYITLFL